jgi:hypothetical protein
LELKTQIGKGVFPPINLTPPFAVTGFALQNQSFVVSYKGVNMKKTIFSLFLAALLCVLNACSVFYTPAEKTVAISGTVTITRNGIPWTSDNFPLYSYSRASSLPPPEDRPIIYANFGGGWISEAVVSYQTGSDDYQNGTYQWELDAPAGKINGSVYFTIQCLMRDVDSSLTKTTKEFAIQDRDNVIDIGVINFDVIQLFGNLPITINGEPSGDDTSTSGYASRKLNIFVLPNKNNASGGSIYPDWSAYIAPDGSWSLNIEQPDSEKSLEFLVEVRQNGGFLRKMLITENPITIFNTDKEIVFEDYPSVDLEAFHLSGTIEVVAPGTGESRYYEIRFHREDAEFADNYFNGPYGSLFSDMSTGWSASGRKEWKTTIPALELPHELKYSFSFYKGMNMYRGHSSITITDDTDLSRIDLGVFTFQ